MVVNEAPVGPGLRWGIVGPGRIARTQIIPAIGRMGAGLVVACASSSAAAARSAADQLGIAKAHESWRQLVEDPGIDVVYVATPNAVRRDVVVAAAAAGKHVLCEKPLALSQSDGEAMVAACASAGVVLRMGLQIRLEEVLLRVRALIREGAIGEVRAMSLERMAPPVQSGAWREQRSQGGSILYDVGVHLLDLAPWIAGVDICSIAALSHRRPGEDAPDLTVTVLAGMANGAQAVLRCSREMPFAGNDLVVMGSKGILRTGPLRWTDIHRLVTETGTSEERFRATDLYGAEVAAFAADIRDGGSRLPSGEDGLRLIALTRMAEDALRDSASDARCFVDKHK